VQSAIMKQLTEHTASSSSQEFASTKTIAKEKVRRSRRSTLTKNLSSCKLVTEKINLQNSNHHERLHVALKKGTRCF